MPTCLREQKKSLLEQDEQRPGDLFEGLQEAHPKLYRYMNSPALKRWMRSSDKGWITLRNIATRCNHDVSCGLDLDSKTFSFDGSVGVEGGTTLVVTINSFKVKELDRETGSWAELGYGRRPESLNTSFANLLGVLLTGVVDVVRENPNIASVRFKGNTVLNAHLEKTLKEFGFEAKSGLSQDDAVALSLKLSKGVSMAAKHSVNPEITGKKKIGKATATAAGAVATKRLRRQKGGVGRTFALDLKVKGRSGSPQPLNPPAPTNSE